jgi:hypothetical protein
LFGSTAEKEVKTNLCDERSSEVENETGLLMGDSNLTIKKKIQTDSQKR